MGSQSWTNITNKHSPELANPYCNFLDYDTIQSGRWTPIWIWSPWLPPKCRDLPTGPHNVITAHLAILPSSDYILSIWRVCKACHIVEVALLFHDVCFTLPLPHQQLPQANTTQSNPVPCTVQCYGWDALVWDTETGISRGIKCSVRSHDICSCWNFATYICRLVETGNCKMTTLISDILSLHSKLNSTVMSVISNSQKNY